jgi:GH15 family glucan-1,4-alpha-glucosidase
MRSGIASGAGAHRRESAHSAASSPPTGAPLNAEPQKRTPSAAEPAAIPRTIEAHGVVGDQGTAALIADDGTVDFLCWPALDSPTVFAGLLDVERGGAWALAPVLEGARTRQVYLPDTNVLRTTFSSPDGIAEITDFMPFPEPGGTPRLVRRVRVVRGTVAFRSYCAPRFDYARAITGAEADGEASVVFRAAGEGGPVLRLTGTVPLRIEPHEEGAAAVADFTLAPGERADFMLLDVAAPPPAPGDAEALMRACSAHWQAWVGRMHYQGRWREMVTRSALALKLLVSERHGSIAAAVTFGLPESPGGGRNWDYRATWIRDASFTIYAFMRLGYVDEANAFMGWIGDRARENEADGSIQIMYGLDGRKRLDEAELTHLRGYGGAGPVRIGNAAYLQVQLDIYGELLDAGYLANKYGYGIPQRGWNHVVRTVDYVCAHWRDADQGIWEMRGPARRWLHSRLMCWVAVDRASRLALKRSLPSPVERWHAVRDEIHKSIWQDFWDDKRGHFVAATDMPPDGPSLDAAMLMMPLVRFVSGTDPQWLATLDAIGHELAEGPLVFRYRGADGLAGQEGAFTACSFWFAECLARANRFEQARRVFDAMLGYANPVGLLSEEIGPSGEQLGNTPQALTHLALISAAFYLDRELGAAGR